MPDAKISGLPAVAAFAGTQEFAVNDSGVSRKISGTQLIAAVAQGTLPSGYAQVTANSGLFTAQTDMAGVTVTVTLAASRRIEITAKLAYASSVAADTVQSLLIDTAGPTTIDIVNAYMGAANVGFFVVHHAILIPGAGAKTYKIAALRNSGTGNITMQAGPTFPAFILVEDIGT